MSVSSSEFLLKKLFFRMELLLRGLMKAKIKESTKIGIYLYNNKMIVEAIFLILIGIFIGISQSAGIGGGTIINVLLIVGLGYNAKDSVIVTYIFLMGGGLASTLASLKKKTEQGRRLIDYDLVMITLPMMMSGAIFGTILNHFISELIITLIFLGLIFYLIYTTYQKYQDVKHKDNNQILNKNNNKLIPLLENSKSIINSQQAGRLEEILTEDNNIFPKEKLKIILQIYLYTFIILVCRGGKTYDSLIGLQSCSIGSWIFAFLHLFLSYLYSKSIAIKKFQLDLEKESLGYVFEDQNEKMSDRKMREGMLNGFLSGVLGACVSIGGGMVLVPLWFKSGIDRNVATSSTGPLIFFSSSISFLISAMLGKYDSILLVLLFFIISFSGSYLIKNLLIYLIEKYQFKVLVLVLLLFMMVVSLIALLPAQFHKYMDDPQGFMDFGELC